MKTNEKNSSQQPLVSVVINNYNYGRFIGDAIDSALNQTYSNVEVIVVDDGSTDDSREVIESYGEKIKAVFKLNGGQASAMNRGFEAAAGELIYFLDSDDIALPDCLASVVETYLAENKTTALINFRMCLVDAQGVSLEQFSPPDGVNLPGFNVGAQLRAKGTFRHQPTSANVFSAKSLEKIMPIPEEDFRICAETYMCYHAPLFGEVSAVEKVLVRYRVHQSNNYHQPEKAYDSSEIARYVKKQESFYAAIEKSRRYFSTSMNMTIGGNARLLHLIFRLANRKLSGEVVSGEKPPGNFRLAFESLSETLQSAAPISGKRKIAVALYLATMTFLPRKMVCSLVFSTFIQSPKSFNFVMKNFVSR